MFTPEQVQLFIDYVGLTGLEADYMTYLVQYERSGSHQLKKVWESKLDEIRSQSLLISRRVKTDQVLSETDKVTFYSSPLYSAIRLFVSTGENGKSIHEICERFDISRARASDMLSFLVAKGLCTNTEGRYLMGAQKTHLAHGSPHLLRHHSNWRLRAIQHSEGLSDSELMYTAPVSLSDADFRLLREEMVSFIDKFLERVHASPAEDIACFNLDFFKIKK